MTDEKKRSYVRFNNEFNVKLSASDDNAEFSADDFEISTSKSINISASGLLVCTGKKLSVGSTVNVTFMKPHSFEFFRGMGRVVWTKKERGQLFKTAVNFINLTIDDQKRLDYYLRLIH